MPDWITGASPSDYSGTIYGTPGANYLGFGNNAMGNGYSAPGGLGFAGGLQFGGGPGSDDPQDFQNWLSSGGASLLAGQPGNLNFNYTLAGDGTPIDPNTLPGQGQTLPGLAGTPGTATNGTWYNIANGIGQSLGSPQGLWNAVQGNITGPTSQWWTSPLSALGGIAGLIGGPAGTGGTTGGTAGTGAFNVAFGNPDAFSGIGGSLNQIAGQQGLPYGSTGLGGNTGLLGSQYQGLGGSDPGMSFADWAAYNAWAGVNNPTGAPIGQNGGIPGSTGSAGTNSGVVGMSPYTVNETPYGGGNNYGVPNNGSYGAVTTMPTYGVNETPYNGGTGTVNPSNPTVLPPYLVNDYFNRPENPMPKPGNPIQPGTGTITPPTGGFTPPAYNPPGFNPPTLNPPSLNPPGNSPAGGDVGGGGGSGSTGTSGDRNAYLEGLAQNYAQAGLAPQQLAQYGAYSGANAAIDARNLGISLFGAGGPSTIAGQYSALTQGQQDPLLQQQNAIASRLLSEGGNLSASDLRNVQQSSRGAFAARGLDATNASIVDEAMQTDAAQRNRLLQNLGIASGVVGQNQAQTGLINANNSSLFGLAANQTNASNAYTRNQFDPFNNYGMDLANTNYNAGQARQIQANNNALALTIAGQNADAAKSAATTSTLGNIFGAWLGRCWVAREIYGENAPDWVLFKYWLEHKGPKWFLALYDKYGKRFAAWVRHHPHTKNVIRKWMDSRIATLDGLDLFNANRQAKKMGMF